MPSIVNTDIGEIRFSDEYSPEQIEGILREQLPSWRERIGKGVVRDLASRFPRDVAVAGADTLMGLARGWQQFRDYGKVGGIRQMGALAALNAPVGEENAAIQAANEAADAKAKELEATREQRLAENPLYRFGEESRRNAREFYEPNPLREGSIPAMLSQGLASTVPVIATAPLGAIAAATTYGAMSGEQGAQEAITMGHPDKADEAYILFAGLGALSEAALGYPIWFLRQIQAARQSGIPPAQFGKTFLATVGQKAASQGGIGVVRESAQEATEQAGQNVVASDIVGYDPTRPVMQGVPQAAAIGGVVGGGLGAVGGAAMAIDQARARRAAEAQIPALLREQPRIVAEEIVTPQPIVRPEEMTPEQAAVQEQAIAEFLRQRPTTAPAPPAAEPPRFRPPIPEPAEPTPAPPAEPVPAPAPRRRSPAIVPESERPRFRPPVTPVTETGTAITPPSVPIPETAELGYTPPSLPGPPEAPTPVVPEAQQKGVAEMFDVNGEPARFEVDSNENRIRLWKLDSADQRTGSYHQIMLPAELRQAGAAPNLAQVLNGKQVVYETTPEYGTVTTIRQPTQPQETPNAIQIGSPAQVPVQAPPESRQEVGAQIRDAERPAVPQTETPQAQGQVEPERKAAEEQFESELVVRARERVRQSASPDQAYDQLVQLYESMPRLGTRTAASKTAQAYSTPPPLAFLAGRLIGLESGQKIGEPTAGNGMLLIGARDDAELIANELDPNRNARLKQNFPRAQLSMLDATSQDFFDYLQQWQPDRLVMNPPFGGRVEEGGQTRQRFPIINASTAKADTPSIDLAIALNSLETMAPDGRAVIIIGSKTGTMGPQFSPNAASRAKDYQRPEMLEFFQRFNITDWFTVSGKLYEKMGAGWPVDVIVINGKRGTLPTAQGGFPRPWVTPPKVYNSWAELKEKLYETPSAVQPQQPPTQPEPEPAARPEPRREPGRPTGRAGGATLRQPGGRQPDTGRTPELLGQPRTPPAAPRPTTRPEREEPTQPTGGPTVIPPSRPEPAPSGPQVPQPSGRREETGEGGVPLGEGSTLLNVPFKPVSNLGGANLVAPRNVADAMSRAVSEIERETGMSIDDYVAQKLGWTKDQLAKRFSSAQAEAVGLFIRNLEQRGTGLINSDQTGVGKGRSVAAVIHYALKNGKIPIFITAKKQLYSDMAGRDLPAIGITTFQPFITDSQVEWTNGKGEDVSHSPGAAAQRDSMREIAQSGKLPAGINGVFTTYEQLKSDLPQGWKETPRARMARKKKFDPRPDGPRFAMLRRLAPNAIFILDEAHQAAGLDSDVGLLLQSILPNAAGAYYASATFAKRPDNLNIYALGTAMKKAGLSRKELGDVFTSGGVPLQQALTSMLTESGEFVRREQNMEGVDFKFEATGTDPEKETELADTYTSFLRDLFQLSNQVNSAATAFVDNENQVRAEGEEVDLASVTFGSRLFNLSSQYLFSLRADATVQKALAALKGGQKPFIAVYNTMAGPIADLQKRGLPINYSGMLQREMEKMLEVLIKDPTAPGDPANKVPKGKRKIILKPEDLSDGGRFYYQLRDQIVSTDFSQMPISPIDTIKNAIKKAGHTIGELTGRQGEVEETNESIRITKREKLERNKVLSDFNNGALDALIVNASADTGVSAHTDPRFKDQRQRHMIIAQPNPDINGFMQIVGRVMRFGQTKVPTYTIIASSLATERRFNTMLRAKLNSLNANTTADTESGITQSGLTEDIFNPIGDEVVAQVMAQNPELASLALINLPDPSVDGSMDNFARRATGHFVLLPNADAEQLWSEIADTYRATIKALDDAGENPLKADVVDLRAKTTKAQTIQEGTGKTLFDGPVVLETADVKPPQPALTGRQALDMAVQGREAAEARAQEWLNKYGSAREQRLGVMRQRESTDAQIDATAQNFQRTREAVEQAVRLLGEPVGVRSASGEGIDFYAVPIGLMLKSDNTSDFSGASKHSLVLATNSMRRQITLPLSQLSRVEQATIEAFDSERDQSGIRHIVTGNLLRGVKDAIQIARGTTKPKVTIYSTSDNQVKTGILMAPGWRPEDGLRALGKVLKNSAEMKAALDTGKLVTAGPVLIRGNSFSVPSRNEFRAIWSDPQFARLFDRSPIERRGEFAGELTTQGRNALFDFLRSKGLTPTLQAIADEGTKYSVTLQDTPEARVSVEDIQRAFPESQGFFVYPSITRPNSWVVALPNFSVILIDPTRDVIEFDVGKIASDWGVDPELVARFGIARGSFRKIPGKRKSGLLQLLNTSGPDTLSHEKFHALFWMALNPNERDAILSRYKTEEKAAEAFRRSEGFTRSFWETIRRFIERLISIFRGDVFRPLRTPIRPDPALGRLVDAMTGDTTKMAEESLPETQYSLETILRDRRLFEDFLAKPTISKEEAASLRQQAGAGAGLVPDAIAEEVEALQTAAPDTVEGRMASLLDFVLKLHGVAPALELQKILSDTNIAEDVKQAAISNVLRQIEHVRIKTEEIEGKLQEANAKLAGAIKNGKKITAKRLVEARSKQIADNLISRYRQYLTAQAANLPANQNLAAARAELIQGMRARLDRNQTESPDSMWKAIERIAERISELPVSEGPIAVTEAIRQKGILRDVAGDPTIDLLTAEKPGGLAPLLASPEAGAMLQELAALQKKAETYAKQIEVIEQAFSTKGEPTPVELRKFADTYRKFRNKQTEAAKAIREMDDEFRKADEDSQVYGRSHDLLTRLQNDPQFRQQVEAAISRPGGEIFRDIIDAKNPELEKVYTSPLVQTNEEGKEVQNTYRVYLAPDRVADESSLRDMQMLVAEIDEFLEGDVNPVERQTWETRRDYIVKYLLQPKFSQKTQMLQFGRVNLNPFSVVQLLAGGRARGPRSELEKMAFRAANEANTTFRVADQALVGYKFIGNNTEFGDAATKVSILEAVESHGWSTDRITFWDETVLNPILASGQTAGQMRLKAGDFIPGTGIKITKEDMEVARKQKRYSQGIVQTTQGTAKGLPGLLIDNPILIKTTIFGRKALRGALSPGQFTMARRFSTWSQLFANAWTKATPEGRRRMVNDGEHFQKAVLGYVSTTNPEFNNSSPLKAVYETFAVRAKEDEEYQVQSFDQLLDRLAAIAVEKRLYPSVAEAVPQIEASLLAEVGQHVQAIQKHFEEEGYTDDTPQTVMQYASAKSAFTTERKNMIAPDPYYDYTLTHDSDRIGFVAAGYQQFQLRQIDALKALKLALDRKEGEFAEEIGRLRHKGMSRRKSVATVQKKSETQLDRTRFSFNRLHAHKRVIEKVLKDLSENVIDVRDPNDSAVLLALSRVTANLSSSLLSSPTAMANNLFGGIAANSVILRNLGMATLVGTPVKATAHTTGALVKKVLLTFAPQTLIGRVARSNMPVVKEMAAMVDNQLRNWTQQYLEMQMRGLVAPTDMRNRMRAQSALRASAGAIEREPTPMIAAIPNWLESLPGIQQFLGHLRDKVPRLGDEVVNMGAAGVQTSEVFDFLKLQAVKAFEAREAAGEDINASNYFTNEDNLLSPKELGMTESTGYRDSDSLRQLFEVVGNLDGFLRDYYNRQKAAPEGQKHTVPLFENPADEGAVLYDMAAHGNIPTAGFTPPSMAGVGQRGLIKKMLFMFQNYVLRQAAQAERLADKDLRDPRGWREAYALWGILATLIVWALAGMLATETGVPVAQLITGRSPSRVTAENVIADPDAAMLARYVGMALGNNLPYYGQVISQVLGNPGYGSKWDAANLIPIAGLVRDVNTTITRIGQTGDPVFPAVDFLNRWLPPVSPVLRLLPGVEGDIEARNAARALRVVGPSAGMELAGGGGGQSVQTPASAAVRRLISAAYRGDQDGIRSAFEEAVREKTEQGSPDPERAVMQSLASAVPARRVYGKSITPAEEAQLKGIMSSGQRAAYARGQDAFDLINQTLGTRLSLTSTPRARTRGQATRRALFTDSATPIFASRRSRSRRRRLGGRRRSAFRRLQIRGASRRRRRSPARFSFAA